MLKGGEERKKSGQKREWISVKTYLELINQGVRAFISSRRREIVLG